MDSLAVALISVVIGVIGVNSKARHIVIRVNTMFVVCMFNCCVVCMVNVAILCLLVPVQ